MDIAVGVAHGDDLGAQLRGLLAGEDRHVAGAGDDHGLALEAVVLHALEHFLGQVAQAVSGGLGTDQRAAEFQTLAGEDAGVVAAADTAVLAEQEADLTGTDADITGGHVHELADMAVQLSHEALAEAHDFAVALALGVEVTAALGTAHGQAGQAVFQNLLEAQEFQDGQVDRGVEPKAALVRADGGAELDAVAAVDMDLSLVVNPRHPEGDHTLRFHKALDDALLLVFRMLAHDEVQTLQNFQNGLVEFPLIGIAGDHLRIHALQVFTF